MTRDDIDAICAALPGATPEHPQDGGLDSWKVGGKMFACFGTREPGVSVKTASVEEAAHLISLGVARRAPYFHRSWVRMEFDSDPALVQARIEASHALIFGKLPKATRTSIEAASRPGHAP